MATQCTHSNTPYVGKIDSGVCYYDNNYGFTKAMTQDNALHCGVSPGKLGTCT